MADENSKHAAGEGWHSDVSSESEPPGLSMLRMEEVPSSGGDTLFANMYAAYESLSPAMQAFVETLTAKHDPIGHYLYVSGAKKLEELPSAIHRSFEYTRTRVARRYTSTLALSAGSLALIDAKARPYFNCSTIMSPTPPTSNVG